MPGSCFVNTKLNLGVYKNKSTDVVCLNFNLYLCKCNGRPEKRYDERMSTCVASRRRSLALSTEG